MRKSRLTQFILMALFASGGCASNSFRPAPGLEQDPPAVVSLLTRGSWGMPEENDCARNPHTVHFSDDLRRMILTFSRNPVDDKFVYEYRVRSISGGRIRADMVGEDRRLSSGDLVVWDLEMTSEDGYLWRVANEPGFPPSLSVVRCPS